LLLCFGLKKILFKLTCIIQCSNITQVFDADLRLHFPEKWMHLHPKLQQLILNLQDSQSSVMAYDEHPLVPSNKLFFKTAIVSQFKSHWHSSTRHTRYCQIQIEKQVNTFTKNEYLLLIKEYTCTMLSSLTSICSKFCFLDCSCFHFILFCWSERLQNLNLIQVTSM
jgi:hypothetical protein